MASQRIPTIDRAALCQSCLRVVRARGLKPVWSGLPFKCTKGPPSNKSTRWLGDDVVKQSRTLFENAEPLSDRRKGNAERQRSSSSYGEMQQTPRGERAHGLHCGFRVCTAVQTREGTAGHREALENRNSEKTRAIKQKR